MLREPVTAVELAFTVDFDGFGVCMLVEHSTSLHHCGGFVKSMASKCSVYLTCILYTFYMGIHTTYGKKIKKGFYTKEDAEAWRIVHQYNTRHKTTIYRCRHCDLFHVGRAPSEYPRALRRANKWAEARFERQVGEIIHLLRLILDKE